MDKYFSINAEGCSIRCKLYADDPARIDRLIVFLHGFGGHKDNKAAERFAGRILEKNRGAAVLVFDWPCHGEDVRKVLRLADCDRYLRLVTEYARDRWAPRALYAYATSFGAYLLLKYVSEHENPFTRIALRCPAVNMYAVLTRAIMTEEDLERIGRGKPIQVGFDRKISVDREFLESLREADISRRDFLPLADDMLILHGTKDEIVPMAEVLAFAEDNVIEFESVEGADHRFQDKKRMDYATVRVAEFFDMR